MPRRSTARLNPAQAHRSVYQELLARMQGLRLVYTTLHWTSLGPEFYGDHLLFEQLYKDLNKPIDALGERMVTYFGPESVNVLAITDKMFDVMAQARVTGITGDAENFRRALALEDDLRKTIKVAWELNQQDPEGFSLGMDDYLASLSNQRDQACYFLEQRYRRQRP
jgi:DNA-binding ferritin-like protein